MLVVRQQQQTGNSGKTQPLVIFMKYLDFDPVQLMRQALEHGLAKLAPPEQPKKRDRAKYMRDYRAKHRVPKPIGRKSETGLSDKGLGHAEYCKQWRKLRKEKSLISIP